MLGLNRVCDVGGRGKHRFLVAVVHLKTAEVVADLVQDLKGNPVPGRLQSPAAEFINFSGPKAVDA